MWLQRLQTVVFGERHLASEVLAQEGRGKQVKESVHVQGMLWWQLRHVLQPAGLRGKAWSSRSNSEPLHGLGARGRPRSGQPTHGHREQGALS